MGNFNLQKNDKFSIDKGIKKVLVGLGWDVAQGGVSADLDAHALGCVIVNGSPKLYGDGSHALSYCNGDLRKGPGKAFSTLDGSLSSSGDDRSGDSSQGGDDEVIKIDFDKLPAEIEEIGIFVTIYDAISKKQSFSDVQSCYIRVVDEDANKELCRFSLTTEFNGCISAQIGSLIKESGKWTFKAIGAGMQDKGLGDILQALS